MFVILMNYGAHQRQHPAIILVILYCSLTAVQANGPQLLVSNATHHITRLGLNNSKTNLFPSPQFGKLKMSTNLVPDVFSGNGPATHSVPAGFQFDLNVSVVSTAGATMTCLSNFTIGVSIRGNVIGNDGQVAHDPEEFFLASTQVTNGVAKMQSNPGQHIKRRMKNARLLSAVNHLPSVFCPAGCGNGRVESSEMCDDGNTVDGDGCSQNCGVEAGFQCVAAKDGTSPSQCSTCASAGLISVNDGVCSENVSLPVSFWTRTGDTIVVKGVPIASGQPIAVALIQEGQGSPATPFICNLTIAQGASSGSLLAGYDLTGSWNGEPQSASVSAVDGAHRTFILERQKSGFLCQTSDGTHRGEVIKYPMHATAATGVHVSNFVITSVKIIEGKPCDGHPVIDGECWTNTTLSSLSTLALPLGFFSAAGDHVIATASTPNPANVHEIILHDSSTGPTQDVAMHCKTESGNVIADFRLSSTWNGAVATNTSLSGSDRTIIMTRSDRSLVCSINTGTAAAFPLHVTAADELLFSNLVFNSLQIAVGPRNCTGFVIINGKCQYDTPIAGWTATNTAGHKHFMLPSSLNNFFNHAGDHIIVKGSAINSANDQDVNLLVGNGGLYTFHCRISPGPSQFYVDYNAGGSWQGATVVSKSFTGSQRTFVLTRKSDGYRCEAGQGSRVDRNSLHSVAATSFEWRNLDVEYIEVASAA